MTGRKKIAFISALDSSDRNSWSGTMYNMSRALQKHCGDVTHLGPLYSLYGDVLKLSSKILRLIACKQYDYSHDITLSKIYSKLLKNKLSQKSYDIIFAPAASTEIAFLDTKIPIVYLSDATYALMESYHPDFTNIIDKSRQAGNLIEERAIRKTNILLYPTEWAANSAVQDYHATWDKIRIIPFGANLENPPSADVVINKRKTDRCRLLFIGVNWERKGGPVAFQTLLKLEARGIRSELVVCGSNPPSSYSHPHMTVYPFLDKNDRSQRETLTTLFLTSDFLILPSQNECFGIVLCEANAFGMPGIASNTGGIPGVIQNGENGFLLSPDDDGEGYAEIIANIYQDDNRYYGLIHTSRAAYESRLNWDIWGKKLKKIIDDVS